MEGFQRRRVKFGSTGDRTNNRRYGLEEVEGAAPAAAGQAAAQPAMPAGR